MEQVMHLVIKKDYAISLIDQLIKEEAVELIEEEAVDIPKHQKEAVLKAIESYKADPESARPWDEIKKKYRFLP